MAYATADQFIPGPKSKAEDWIAWYKMIPGGASVRNSVWLKAWAKWGSSAANTTTLRTFMRDEAGVEISTNGAGKFLDTSSSIVSALEDLAKIPFYALLAGGVFVLGAGSFMIYQGFKNPEIAGRFVGSAAKTATRFDKGGNVSVDSGNGKYWFYGAAGLITAASIVYFYYSYTNKQVINNILAAIDHTPDPILGSGAGSFGDSRDLGVSQVFTTTYWRKNPNNVTIWAMNADKTQGPAMKLATQIWEAKSTSDLSRLQIRDYPEKVVAAFKQLKTKEDISKLADVFEGMYKTNLWNFINSSWMSNGCSADENDCYFGISINYLKQVYDWIVTQLK